MKIKRQLITIDKNPIYVKLVKMKFKTRLYEIIKRFFDILLSILALLLFIPFGIVFAIIIKAEDGGPIFFKQERLTKNGKKFIMYKFRSMEPNAEENLSSMLPLNQEDGPVFKVKNDSRITKIGKFLRRSSVDEIPQFWNIIKGDMSIVGPRPPIPREVEQYNEYQMQRLSVKTGLACYHEIRGRSSIRSFNKWVEQDLEYIRNRGLWTDFKIILHIPIAVFTRKGAE